MSAFFGAIVGVILVAVVTFGLIIVACFVYEDKKEKMKSDKNEYSHLYKPFDYKFDYSKAVSESDTTTDIDRLDKRMDDLIEEIESFEIEFEDILERLGELEKSKNSESVSSPDENKERDIPVISEEYSKKFNELVEETANKNKKKKAKADEKETKDEQH